jgi:hypothetical protein
MSHAQVFSLLDDFDILNVSGVIKEHRLRDALCQDIKRVHSFSPSPRAYDTVTDDTPPHVLASLVRSIMSFPASALRKRCIASAHIPFNTIQVALFLFCDCHLVHVQRHTKCSNSTSTLYVTSSVSPSGLLPLRGHLNITCHHMTRSVIQSVLFPLWGHPP